MKRLNNALGARILLPLTAVALLAGPLGVPASLAGDAFSGREEHGLFLGLNAGLGGSTFEYKTGTRHVTEEATAGAMGALRVGYAFNPRLALSLEVQGFGGTRDRDDEWGVGAGLVALTWHPRGGGFFVRGGIGGGGGDFINPDTEQKVTVEDRFAWLFGVGYDWRLSKDFSLGLAAEGFSLEADGDTGYDEDHIGASGLTMQFTWHL